MATPLITVSRCRLDAGNWAAHPPDRRRRRRHRWTACRKVCRPRPERRCGTTPVLPRGSAAHTHQHHLPVQYMYMHAFTNSAFTVGWRFSDVVASFARSCSTLSPVSAGMGDRLRAGIPPRYVTKPTRSTQPCILLGSLNRVPALIGWVKGGNVTSAGWQVTCTV